MRTRYALILAVLAAAFLLRVVGQALVAFGEVKFLPPMSQWYSGLMPYAVLLPVQVVILAVQVKVSWDVGRGAGFFARCRPGSGKLLRRFSIAYFIAMAVRYVATMYLYPERRWFFGTIPIFFHWVLAAYLFVLAKYQMSAACVAGPLRAHS